jgi:hypothetical protein
MQRQRRIGWSGMAFGFAMACFVSAWSVAAADDGKWPATKANEPAPTANVMPSTLAKNLANFDDLDFHVYSGQQWENLHRSHAQNIVVHYPDGHTTKGILVLG